MLERQNVVLVSLINISGEEFVFIKQQQPERNSKNKTQFNLRSSAVGSSRSLCMNYGSYQITNSTVSVQYIIPSAIT